MYEVWSLKNAFQALKVDATKALEVMARMDYLHQDVSARNILFCDGHGKLCDLDYAITPGAPPEHGVRTSTLDFMAVEVFHQSYHFLPAPPNPLASGNRPEDICAAALAIMDNIRSNPADQSPDFKYTALHDLESLWWVGVWILSWNAPNGCLLDAVKEQVNAALSLFPIPKLHRATATYGDLLLFDGEKLSKTMLVHFRRSLPGMLHHWKSVAFYCTQPIVHHGCQAKI